MLWSDGRSERVSEVGLLRAWATVQLRMDCVPISIVANRQGRQWSIQLYATAAIRQHKPISYWSQVLTAPVLCILCMSSKGKKQHSGLCGGCIIGKGNETKADVKQQNKIGLPWTLEKAGREYIAVKPQSPTIMLTPCWHPACQYLQINKLSGPSWRTHCGAESPSYCRFPHVAHACA